MDETFCFVCSTRTPDAEISEVIHRVESGGPPYAGILYLCARCVARDEPLCSTKLSGIHGEVIAADDEPDHVRRVLAPQGYLVPEERRHHWGFCIDCHVAMHWSVKERNWEALRPDVEDVVL